MEKHTRTWTKAYQKRQAKARQRRRRSATERLQRDHALAEELSIRPLQAHCHLGLATLYAQTGRVEQARVGLSAAVTLYRAMEIRFWLPRTEAALAQVG